MNGAGRPPDGPVAGALRWRPSPLLHRLSAAGGLALALAAVLGRAELVVVAAPLLWWLAVAGRSRPEGAAVVHAVEPSRCGEGDEVAVTVTFRTDAPVDLRPSGLELPPGMRVRGTPDLPLRGVTEATLTWRIGPERWGRWTLGPVRLDIRAAGGLLRAGVAVPLGQLAVLPAPEAVEAALLPAVLPPRTGDHPVPAPGEGVEFEGLRPYQPGDRPRRINAAVSARRRELYVTTRRDERSFDLVVLIDAFLRVGPPGADTLDLSVRGAMGLARAHLRRGERVGAVAVGGSLRGLAPGVGGPHLHRIAEAVLDVRLNDSFIDPDITRLPRTVLPPGALSVLFSPLLDDRARLTAVALRRYGHPVVVVDVLCAEPVPDRRSESDRLGLRLWRLDRDAQRFELGRLGVPVVTWDGTTALQAALAPLRHRPVEGRWRRGA